MTKKSLTQPDGLGTGGKEKTDTPPLVKEETSSDNFVTDDFDGYPEASVPPAPPPPPVTEATPHVAPVLFPFSFGSDGWDKPIPWLVHKFIPANAFGLAYGKSGSYKSFCVLDMACHICTGKPWSGKKVDQGAVLYVAAEGGQGVKLRVKAWETIHKTSVNNLAIISQPIPLTENEQAKMVIDTVKAIGGQTGQQVKLVIIDTLARCYVGDENSNSHMGSFVSSCDRIKQETGGTVLVVHHSGKDENQGARGASALRAAADFEYMIKRDADKCYTVNCTKQKDGDEPKPLQFGLTKVQLTGIFDEGQELTSLSVKPEGGQAPKKITKEVLDSDALLTIIKTGKTSRAEAREAFNNSLGNDVKTGTKRSRLSKAIAKLVKAKDITNNGDTLELTE